MKKLFFLCVIALSITSCSLDNNTTDYQTEFLPIEAVDMPSEFVFGEVYEISLSYYRPSSCHVFYDFYYASEQNQRTIAIINVVYSDHDCVTYDNQLVEVSFNFMVNSNEPYVFRFWQGQDDNGNDLYYIVEVPVVE